MDESKLEEVRKALRSMARDAKEGMWGILRERALYVAGVMHEIAKDADQEIQRKREAKEKGAGQ